MLGQSDLQLGMIASCKLVILWLNPMRAKEYGNVFSDSPPEEATIGTSGLVFTDQLMHYTPSLLLKKLV